VTTRSRPRTTASRAGAAQRTAASASSSRRLLLDTHVWLWWQTDDARLGGHARKLIATASEVRLSAASVWEMSIKASLGKLVLPKDADIDRELEADGFLPLPVEIAHADGVRALPPLHRDPFDRMFVSQARAEGLAIVTADIALAAYDVTTVDAES
jgi:PIN domain nuclease of toxin-antitoxin system